MGDRKKHSIVISGHATSISLEPVFWDELTEIARERNVSINTLIAGIDQGRTGSLSSAVRVFVLEELRRRAGIG
jgi:predicted DNA-binding ribbon-helix-helix protein